MAHHPSRRTAVLAVLASAAVVGGSIAVVATATPAAAAGLSPFDIVGRGATVPFIEHEAEEVAHNGTKIGPTRYYGQLPSEASGPGGGHPRRGRRVRRVHAHRAGQRRDVPLQPPGQSTAGTGRDATIDLRANGNLLKTVPVTSKYGWYYGGYPFNNNPGDTNPHHFYDEARAMFGSTQPSGTKIRLQVNSTAQSPTFTIDLADFENVPAAIGQAGQRDRRGDRLRRRPQRRHRLHGRSSRRPSTPARRRAGRSTSRRATTRSTTTSSSTA